MNGLLIHCIAFLIGFSVIGLPLFFLLYFYSSKK